MRWSEQRGIEEQAHCAWQLALVHANRLPKKRGDARLDRQPIVIVGGAELCRNPRPWCAALACGEQELRGGLMIRIGHRSSRKFEFISPTAPIQTSGIHSAQTVGAVVSKPRSCCLFCARC